MEDLAKSPEVTATGPAVLLEAYRGRRVLVTGHTGFKGSWLTLWLANIGANVTGYALAPEVSRNLFMQAQVESRCRHVEGDVRDLDSLTRLAEQLRPEFVFHLAAQSLVRRSYREPLRTFETNVLGTANLLEAIRRTGSPCAVVIITSDKCYENDGRISPYDETDRLGGSDPYSASKAAAEIVTASYRASFFPPERLSEHGVAVATARSGNVIGGGDWSEDRILPDAIRALEQGAPVSVRNPASVRPWQHVLDPLAGYLALGTRLSAAGAEFCEPWNFGPDSDNLRTVHDVVEEVLRQWGGGAWIAATEVSPPYESAHLALSIHKARERLGWGPRWGFEEAVRRTVDWYRCRLGGSSPTRLAELCQSQIAAHLEAADER